jgi:hypothetical protein
MLSTWRKGSRPRGRERISPACPTQRPSVRAWRRARPSRR